MNTAREDLKKYKQEILTWIRSSVGANHMNVCRDAVDRLIGDKFLQSIKNKEVTAQEVHEAKTELYEAITKIEKQYCD